jgi:predicted nucleic acid-binding protein
MGAEGVPHQALRQARVSDTLAMSEPLVAVADCREMADNKYLELGLAAKAAAIVSGDQDLLVLHPLRGIAILRPADYLAWP